MRLKDFSYLSGVSAIRCIRSAIPGKLRLVGKQERFLAPLEMTSRLTTPRIFIDDFLVDRMVRMPAFARITLKRPAIWLTKFQDGYTRSSLRGLHSEVEEPLGVAQKNFFLDGILKIHFIEADERPLEIDVGKIGTE